jgi:hypothetical protein
MAETGLLDEPQEWRTIPEDGPARPNRYYTPLKNKLDMIVKAGAARRPFLLRREPFDCRRKLKNSASNYRRNYGKAGFTFEVRKLPGEDKVGLWTVWKPPADARPPT